MNLEVDYSRDIPVTEFGQHVARMHSENDNLFEVEYKVSINNHSNNQT